VLLPLNEPATSSALQRITDVAGWLLDYVANWSGSAFDKNDFHDSLKSAGLWHLVGSRTAIGKHIPALLTLSKKEREALRDAFYNDIKFYESLEGPDYTFDFPSLPKNAKNAYEIGKAFLLLFYERLAGEGFRDGPKKRSTFAITREDVENAYRAANNEMKFICPACLGSLEAPAEKLSANNVMTKKSLIECEHFFPKSLYPPLIVHPNNLVLVCKVCNQYHNNDSPLHLDPLRALEVGMIRKTFIPYKRSGLASKEDVKQRIDEVKLEFDISNPKDEFVILTSNCTDSFARERVENFDRVYGLSQRWKKEIPDIYEALRDTICNNLEIRGEALIHQNIERQLQIEIKNLNKYSHKSPGAYLRSQYVQWIQQHCMDVLVRELTS
jgi:hypothetical protein